MTTTKNDPYQLFLEEKHSKFETSMEVIRLVVEKATSSVLIEKKRIIEGEINEVYDVTTKNLHNIIVRISRLESSSFEAEEKAMRLASIVGVPAPKVLLIEHITSGSEKLTFCIEEKIEGESLRALMDSLSKNILKSIIFEAGGLLSKINSVTIKGFGALNRTSMYKNWEDYIFSLEERKERIVKAGKIIGVESDLINKAFRLLRENEKMFQLKEAKLLHGDFSPKHLLIKSNHIVGVIDFENAKGGDPVRDFAWINYFYSDAFPIDWLKEGYENKNLFDQNFDLKIKLYRLHLGLDLLDYYESENNKPGMNFTKDRFISELENF